MAKRGKTGSHPQPKQQPSPAYSQALRLYWRGEKESALAALSDSLAEDGVVQPEALHRLWIEILAENQDPGSLRLLLEYLNRQVDFQHPSWIPTFSLIGLIHYELGEREAAQIIQRSLRRHAAHPYCRELDLVLSLADDEAKALHLGRLLVRQSTDYFHHKRCILLSHQQGQFALTQRLLSQLEAVFGSQPLRSEIAFHDAFGQKNYRQAWQHALALRQEFPVHAEYQFFYAYTSYLIDRNKLALHEFLQLNRRHEAEDPDVLSLIGAALLHDGKEPSPRAKARSCHYLQRAIARLKAMGLPTAYPQNLLHRIEGTAVVNSGRYWIVKLSPRQCLELYNRPLERLSYLHRAMGDHVKKGDFCFFMSESRVADENNVGLWKMVALFQAVSDPEWHPLHRWQTALKLHYRLDVGIPIEIEGNQTHPRERTQGPQRYGLLEIDSTALHYIEESIRDFTLEDEIYSQVFAPIRRVSAY
jgi:hypothetical protein